MTYEEYLDEVTTLIFEKYELPENEAVKIVMAAQDREFFVPHDKNAKLRNIDQAHKDAKTLFEAAGSKPAARAPLKSTVKPTAQAPVKSAARPPAQAPVKSAARPPARTPAEGTAKAPAKVPATKPK